MAARRRLALLALGGTLAYLPGPSDVGACQAPFWIAPEPTVNLGVVEGSPARPEVVHVELNQPSAGCDCAGECEFATIDIELLVDRPATHARLDVRGEPIYYLGVVSRQLAEGDFVTVKLGSHELPILAGERFIELAVIDGLGRSSPSVEVELPE